MFKANNKDVIDVTNFPNVSIVDFEQMFGRNG